MKNTLFFFAFLLALAACAPVEEDDIELPDQPAAPTFSMEYLSGDSNRVIVKDISAGFFDHTFDFPGGIPAKSKRAVDTVFYTKAGDYLIGTWDSGPVYDIARLTDTELVLRSPIRAQDGTPGTGWFEFTLLKI